MSKKTWLLSAGTLGLSLSFAAHADPMTWVDYYDFTPDRLITEFTPVSYVHDITDDGFVVGVDTIDTYQLKVNLYSSWDRACVAYVNLPGLTGDRIYFNLSGTESGGWSFAGAWQLQAEGRLSVSIYSLFGSFYLGDSTLTVTGEGPTPNADSDVRSVPEPATLALFGSALLGIGLRRRRA